MSHNKRTNKQKIINIYVKNDNSAILSEQFSYNLQYDFQSHTITNCISFASKKKKKPLFLSYLKNGKI